MTPSKKYAVHADFSHYPAFPFPFNGVVTTLLNQLLHLDTFIRQRKVKAKAKVHRVLSGDGFSFPVFQFDPDDKKAGEILPAVVYYHGGAFVLGYASTHIEAVNFYAQEARCCVFLVDYRLAPKYPFPKGFHDCYAALEWVSSHATSVGVDPEKIAVMGDSAGGCLAASVAQRARDEQKITLCGQVLVYPCVDRTCSTRSATEYDDAPMFNGIANKKMWEVYLADCAGQPIPPYAAPADRRDFSGLPRAYVETAEFDPLCDEGAAYAKRLAQGGVAVTLHEPQGTVHGYDTVFTSAITRDSLKRRIDFLRHIFS